MTATPAPVPSSRPLRDVVVLTGRSLRHQRRGPDALLIGMLLPILILLLFTYVFGGAFDGALPPGMGYLDYVVPGIATLCASYGSASVAVAVAVDRTGGAMDRFRSLPIAAAAVLAGHVLGGTVRNLAAVGGVLAVAVLLGFRPTTSPAAWLIALGVLAAWMLALAWLAAAAGLLAGSVEAAGAVGFVALFAPYLSSTFVPAATMPAPLRALAEHQPVTPQVDAVRVVLLGGPPDTTVALALAWSAGLAAVGVVACALLFRRCGAR